jgi:FkbM family methyltransferase
MCGADVTDMRPSRGPFTGLLKKILFRQSIKHPRLQPLWRRLHTLSVYGMNYGGGGLIETSGEVWALANVVRRVCENAAAPVVFDVGANVGDYSLLVRRHLPSATVYAFEPAQSVYAELAKRLSARGDRGGPFNLGFSDSEKTVDLYSYTVGGQEVSLISSIDRRLPTQAVEVKMRASERVRVETIDRFCEAEAVARIDFLKLDVEGHELSVLRGARRMLDERRVSVLQFEFGPANIYSRTYFYDFWSLLAGGYDIFRIIPEGVVPIPFYGEHLEVFLTTNYLAVGKRTS